MSILDDIKSIEPKHMLLVVSIFIAAVAPGLMLILIFMPEFIPGLDVVKLILLSLSLTLPLILINFFISFSWNAATIESSNPSSKEDQFTLVLLVACLFTAATTYPSILLAYIFGLHFITLLFVIGVFEFILFAIGLRNYMKIDKHGDNASNSRHSEMENKTT